MTRWPVSQAGGSLHAPTRTPRLATLDAAALGALLHGLAGIRAEAVYGESCVTPQTLIDALRLDARALPEEA